MHEGNRIDQAVKVPGVVDYSRPKVGSERFNYELQRHEILPETGWHPAVVLGPSPQGFVAVPTREAELTRTNIVLRAERDAWMTFYEAALEELRLRRRIMQEQDEELIRLRKQLWLPTEPGDHPYHGPLSKPDEHGKRVPIPDPVHERFHGSIGDVLAGKVIPEARRQMQEALKNAPKEKPAFPVGANKDDPKRIGWRMNDAV